MFPTRLVSVWSVCEESLCTEPISPFDECGNISCSAVQHTYASTSLCLHHLGDVVLCLETHLTDLKSGMLTRASCTSCTRTYFIAARASSHSLTDEQIIELKIKDLWTPKCKSSKLLQSLPLFCCCWQKPERPLPPLMNAS